VAPCARFACALLLTALTACGGKSLDADDKPDSGGSNQGGSGHGGTGSAGSGRGGSVNYAGSGNAGTGGAGDLCNAFDDQPGGYVSIAIINKTSAPIYLGQDTLSCGVSPLFGVANDDGQLLAAPSGCRATCQDLRTHGPVGCPAICAFPSSTALEPEQALYIAWDGLYQLERKLPKQCVNPDYGDACWQTLKIQPGPYTFSAIAGRSIDCSQTSGGPCPACSHLEGGCVTPGSLITGPLLKASTSVVLGPAYGVYESAAPLPGNPGSADPPGGNTGAAEPLQNIQIVFTE